MRITVFGAAGRVGVEVVGEALAAGHEVVAFVRDRTRVPGDGTVTVVEGDASDPAAVRRALEGADAVISVMGGRSLDPSTELSDATASVVAGMQEHGPSRLVLLSHVGVLLKKVDPQYEHVVAEHRRNFEVVRASGLDWVAVCPPGIVASPGTGSVQTVVGSRAPEWTIPRGDLARFLVEQVGSERFLHQAVGVSG